MRDPKKHPIDDLFARKLKDAEVNVPPAAWEGIAHVMEADRLRKKVFFARLTAAASLLLLMGFGLWYFLMERPTMGSTLDGPTQWVQLPAPTEGPQLAPAAEELCPPSTLLRAFAGDVRQGDVAFGARPKTTFASKMLKPLLQPLKGRLIPQFVYSDAHNLYLRREALPMPTMAPEFYDPSTSVLFQGPEELGLEINKSFVQAYPNAVKRNTDNPLAEQGEDWKQREVRKRPFSIGGAAAPDFNFDSQTPLAMARVDGASKNALADHATQAPKDKYTPTASITSGLRFGYDVSERIAVQSGVLYTRRNTEEDHQIESYGKTASVASKLSASFVEVPATIKYKVVSKDKWNYFVSSGMSATLFMNYNNSLENAQGTTVARQVSDGKEALTHAQTSVLLSTGVQVKLGKRMSATLEPGMRYGVDVSPYAFSRQHPFSFNAFSGLNYHF